MGKEKADRNSVMPKYLLAALFVILFIYIVHSVVHAQSKSTNASTEVLWPYQCIDTMKTSRDKARTWMESKDLHSDLKKQIQLIKGLGANCVAIDTPYDKEFIPYLTSWTTEAHKNGLHIWFRGNFSSWEGWFNYSKGMSTEKLLKESSQFIADNKNLFEDGDVFTAAPEAENGGPFNQVEPARYALYRQFLVDEYTQMKADFSSIHKNVEVKWLSMNGGFARRMLDAPTISSIGNTVTIDHYVKTPEEMNEYIQYFNKTFNAKVVIGEFGAPIPEINGAMNEDEQATLIDSFMWQMYKQKKAVFGVNYWVLFDSSTALYSSDGGERKVADVVRKYYQPLVISGTIKNSNNQPLKGVTISTADGITSVNSDNSGHYSLTIPNTKTQLQYRYSNYISQTKTVQKSDKYIAVNNVSLTPTNEDIWYKIRKFFSK